MNLSKGLHTLTFLLAMLMASPLHADKMLQRQTAVDSLWTELAKATTPADSLPILYDIYDIGSRAEKRALNRTIYSAAKHAGDIQAQADILRQLGSFYYGNDSVQRLVEVEAARLRNSSDRDETMVFVRMMRATTQAYSLPDVERRKRLHDAMVRYYQRPASTVIGRVEQLFQICIYIGSETRGELLNDFLEKLETEIANLPQEMTALRNLYYTRCALTYTESMQFDHAVDADKMLILTIENLMDSYRSVGRKFRNYNTNLYVCYRRMLCNFPALSDYEIDDYYNKILEIAENDKDVADDLNSNNLAHIYYYMAKKDYASALPLMKPYLEPDTDKSLKYPLRFFKLAKEAAANVGDTPALTLATQRYSDQIDRQVEALSNDSYRELQLVYDVVQLREERALDEVRAEQERVERHRIIILIILCAVVALILIALLIYRQYRRVKTLSQHLSESNVEMRHERDMLRALRTSLTKARDAAKNANRQKSEFLNNVIHEVQEPLNAIAGFSQMIVDSVDDDKRKYLERYADIISLNINLVQSLVSDALTMAEVDHGHIEPNVQTICLRQVCETVIDSVRLRVNPGVKISFDSQSSPDITIASDRRRVEQVLINLLQNAAKFTTEGSITLSYTVDETNHTVTFAVADTGPGIPKSKRELIFERYEKLDKTSRGTGLGLPICRLIARILKGSVTLDETYIGGSRFLFTIPLAYGKAPR